MATAPGTPSLFPIRRAVPADAPLLHALQQRAFAEEGRLSGSRAIPPLAEGVDAIRHHITTQTVLKALDGERIVGAGRGIVDGVVCTLRGFCVEPSHQGRGIGAALLRAVEAAHPQVERFVLTTNTLVPGNVAFYERHGYQLDTLTRYLERVVLAQMSKPARSKNS